ncbi:acyl-ACP--UDP-N-acetylglucosamine O-acyltransferase [Wenzhouxiangella marina]|uniref:Acyl-[acyl-carrier-protein]--UDP-N-acetylglucosamine O-acyltransferase n=1 Tax=Wenzhouxiangella marina TaxID=1579979 RepID=A0A0K0XT62_9GAMM|nr:acyl-ACP--UDP-N-acetylglucosamine O-acyltransferase [Wenzhouxiangella marina]AKS40812.1 Acyl-[acyl-carrier-protein]--UDP-N-acetylglucosamine O-acyltransferase [Wenzhouxiangella marina]MBB6087686.1 UDP-N-acetylglucosamine acyltransferase [Wenzhouxiangella marina]
MIHASAIIEDGASIAEDVEIGPFSIIGPEVTIDAGCWIGPHVVVTGRTRIGANTRIFQFASIGEEPQDKKYHGEESSLEIGEGNTIREYVTINRGTADGGGVTRLGDNNWLMAYCHIAHDCQVGSNVIMANGATLAGHVIVGDWVIFAGYSGAHQFCRIGDHAFLGMYGGVNQDVPAYVMVSGQPPRPRGINSEGLKRRGFSAEDIRHIRDAYRTIYRSGLKRDEALELLRQRLPEQPAIAAMIESAEASQRGLLR